MILQGDEVRFYGSEELGRTLYARYLTTLALRVHTHLTLHRLPVLKEQGTKEISLHPTDSIVVLGSQTFVVTRF